MAKKIAMASVFTDVVSKWTINMAVSDHERLSSL
jgi:hypothetical protein